MTTETVFSLFKGEIVRVQPTRAEILRAVAQRHHLSVADLTGPSRFRHINRARQEAMWEMRQVKAHDGTPRYSFWQIGTTCGGRDHATAMHGVTKHEARLAELLGWAA